MATQQQFDSEAQALANAIKTVDDDLAELSAQAKAIQANPTDPDAQSKLDAIKASFNEIQTAGYGDITQKTYNLSNTYNTLPPDAQKASTSTLAQNAQSAANVKSQLTTMQNSTIPGAQSAINSGVASGTGGNSGQDSNQQDDDSKGDSTDQPAAIKFSTRPRKNPLGNFASCTYQISLYMITPDAYDAFVQSGRKNINALREAEPVGDSTSTGGAFIIAQSGGINNQYRMLPEFQYDYYIDKLSMTTYTAGRSEMNTFDFKATIVEPYGFSFLTNLRRARDRLAALPKVNSTLPAPERQFFILGIRFYGYDQNGNLLTGKEKLSTGDILDPNNSGNGVFEKFYDIAITELKFKLDGKATNYSITGAATAQQEGLGLKRGTLKTGATVQGHTVEEAINELKNKLNLDEKSLNPTEPRNSYDIQFIGNEDEINRLKSASLTVPNDQLKTKYSYTNAKNTKEVTDKESVKATPNPDKKIVSTNNETIVNDFVSLIIKQSTYMTDALKTLYTAQQYGASGDAITNNPTKQQLSWYNLSCELKNGRFNTKLNDWVYDITYVIQPYSTPAVYTPFISSSGDYSFYGPHKTYEYYFTGQNSEILSYEQSYDTTYFNTLPDASPAPGFSAEDYTVPMAAGKRPNVSRMSGFNKSVDAQNQILTILYDPQAQITSKLTILGDPDYLMSPNPSSLNQVYNQFYGSDNYTINPNGGQIFITVDFKEAIDYDIKNGYLSVNDNILFFKYPPEIKKAIKGVIFQVISVTSTFDTGKFTQIITTAVPPLWGSGTYSEDQRVDTEKEAAQAATNSADTRTATSDPNSATPATSGATPGQNNTAKSTDQLVPDVPPSVFSEGTSAPYNTPRSLTGVQDNIDW